MGFLGVFYALDKFEINNPVYIDHEYYIDSCYFRFWGDFLCSLSRSFLSLFDEDEIPFDIQFFEVEVSVAANLL